MAKQDTSLWVQTAYPKGTNSSWFLLHLQMQVSHMTKEKASKKIL